MRTANIIVPQAFLYEKHPSIAANMEKSNIADQVLQGWMVGILDVCDVRGKSCDKTGCAEFIDVCE